MRQRLVSHARHLPVAGMLVLPLMSSTRPMPAVPVSLAAPELLPGRIVDVKAGEFFFRAEDSIPEGLTSFRLEQVGLVVARMHAGAKGRALVADKGDDTRGAHMLWVVRLDSGRTMKDLYEAAQAGQPTAAWAKQLGGPSFALPPRTSNITLDLEPGNYVLVCYIGSARADRTRYHLLNGMSRPLTVTRSAKPHLGFPRHHATARITGDGVVTFSNALRRGSNVIRVENATDKSFEFKFQRMNAPITGKEFLAQGGADGPATPWGGLGDVPPNSTVMTTIDFEPGEYVVGTHPSIRHATSQVVVVRATGRTR